MAEKCGARSRVEPTQMKMYEKFASKTKKRCEARPRTDDFPAKKIKKNVEDRPKNNDFFENEKQQKKKNPKKAGGTTTNWIRRPVVLSL